MVDTELSTITQKPGTFRGHLRQVFWLIGGGVIIPCTITQGGIQTHGTITYSHSNIFVSFHTKDTNNFKHPYSLMDSKIQTMWRTSGYIRAALKTNEERINALNHQVARSSHEVSVKTAPAPARRYADVFIR